MMCSYETTFAPSQTKSLEVIQLQEQIDKMWIQRNRAITLLQNIEEKHQNEIRELKKQISRHRLMAGNLDEENKKLKEENEDNLASLNFYTEQCTELKDERKQLKEENEMLKTEAEDVLQQVADALCGEGDEADSMCGWGHTHKLIKKANDLKKTVTRVMRERNYLGDYEGGATSEEEEEEENENDIRIERMQEYIGSRQVKYCDTCGRYGDEHIDLECDDDGRYWCENCKDDEEEVDTCIKCNKKRECHSDIFTIIDETAIGGKKYIMCGMCSLNKYS